MTLDATIPEASRELSDAVRSLTSKGQVTIPKALRERLGKPRRMEARLHRAELILTPILIGSVEEASHWALQCNEYRESSRALVTL
jgi:hypothetical protein